MLMGLDMRLGGVSHATREYLSGLATAMHAVDPRRQMVVFTEPDQENPFPGAGHYPLASGSARQRAARAGAQALLAPLDTAVPQSGAPQLLVAAEFGFLPDSEAGWREKRRLTRLQQAVAQGTRLVVPWESLVTPAQRTLELALDRIHAVPPGIDPAFFSPTPRLVGNNYLVFAASSSPAHVEAEDALLAAILKRFPMTVVVTGRDAPLGSAFRNERVIQIERCAPRHLASILQYAQAAVLAGVSEDVAFAALPALCAGVPIVTPRIPSVQQVAADVAFFVERHSQGGAIDAVARALEEPARSREDRVRRGRQLGRQYTWEEAAWKVVGLLQRLEKEHGI